MYSPADPERSGRVFKGKWLSLAVPAFLAVQLLAIHAAPGGEHPPIPPAVASFPVAAGQWRVIRQDPLDPVVTDALKADVLMSQTYVEMHTASSASLLVAWYQTQQGGARQPHSPKFCLPGSGWTPEVVDDVTVGTAAGAITVNRYIVVKGEQRAVVLYWYQTPWRVIASEWAAKFWVAVEAIRKKRTDTALIRVVVWSRRGEDEKATAVATALTRDLYPTLQKYLPQ